MNKIITTWLLIVLVVSCILGVVHVVVQQDMRIGANDPQIQMAEDTAVILNTRSFLNVSQHKIDIAQSLAPFIMTFDANGQVRSSEAELDGQTPTVPAGIFAYVTSNGEDRLTWQPRTGVRIAAVVTKYNNGYVLVGRNLREVEKREDMLFVQIVFGWVVTLVVSFIAVLLFLPRKK